MQLVGPLGGFRCAVLLSLAVAITSLLSSSADAAVTFFTINGEVTAAVPGDAQNELVTDLSGNGLSLQNFGAGIIDQAAASIVPTLSVHGNVGTLFEFSTTATSTTNRASDPPSVANATSSANFEQLFQTNTAHRVTMIATVSQANGGEAAVQIANVLFPNSPIVSFSSATNVEQYRSFLLAPGTYAISADVSSEVFDIGSSSGSVGGSLSVSLAADTSGDAYIDGEDLGLWQDTYGGVGISLAANGDFNSNFLVDASDYLLWQQQFSPEPAPRFAAVPSPSAGMLVTWGIGLLLVGRCRLSLLP